MNTAAEMRKRIEILEATITGEVADAAADTAAMEEIIATEDRIKAMDADTRASYAARKLRLVEGAPATRQALTGDESFRAYLRHPEARSMTIGAAGTTTLPDVVQTSVAAEMIKARDLASVMRGLCSVVSYAGNTKVNRLTSRATAAWTAEAAAFNASDLDTTAITFEAWKTSITTSSSVELIQDSILAVEAEIASDHGRGHARAQEEAFVNGNGVAKPLGIFQATWDTAPAAGDGTLTVSDLVSFFYGNMPASYQATAVWVMSSANFGVLANVKDSTGQFLLSTAANNVAVSGAAAMICGRPVYLSEWAPSGKVFCGDLSVGYRIADRVGFTFQADPYSLSTTGYVRFNSFARTDGDVIEPGAGGIYTI